MKLVIPVTEREMLAKMSRGKTEDHLLDAWMLISKDLQERVAQPSNLEATLKLKFCAGSGKT